MRGKRRAVAALGAVGLLTWWAWPHPTPEEATAPSPGAEDMPEAEPSAPEEAPAAQPVALGDVHGAERATVSCELATPLPEPWMSTITEVHADTGETLGRVLPALDGTWMTFRPRQDTGIGILEATRMDPTPFAWVDGACTDLVEAKAHPTGQVRVHYPEGRVFGAWTSKTSCSDARTEDGVYTVRAEQPCEVWMVGLHAGRWWPGPRQSVRPRDGEVIDVLLEMPDYPEGVVGWTLYRSADGPKVLYVEPGTVAHDLGLRRGDVLLEVDGDEVLATEPRALEGWSDVDEVRWLRDGEEHEGER